jgi:hypothetical protein
MEVLSVEVPPQFVTDWQLNQSVLPSWRSKEYLLFGLPELLQSAAALFAADTKPAAIVPGVELL